MSSRTADAQEEARLVGERMRASRKAQGLTLEDLSANSGVSISTLSRIENGLSSASFDTVLKVSRALKTNFIQLGTPILESTPSGLLTVTKAKDVECWPAEQVDYLLHSKDLVAKKLIPMVMKVHAKSPPEPEDWSRHIGEEFVYVLEGSIDLHTEFYAPRRLNAGDSAQFDSAMKHVYVSAVDDSDPLVLSIFVGSQFLPPSERIG